LISLVLLTGSNASAQSTAEFIYVVNNNFYDLNYGQPNPTPDPNGSLSTITVWKFDPDAINPLTGKPGTLTKIPGSPFAPLSQSSLYEPNYVANKDASLIDGSYRLFQGSSPQLTTFIYNPIGPPYNATGYTPKIANILLFSNDTGYSVSSWPMPMGGQWSLWNTIASWLNPAGLAVNDYYNGPTLWQIDTNSGAPTWGTPSWQQSVPGGNVGSALAYSIDGNSIFVGDYTGSFRVIQNVNGTWTATGPFDVAHNGAYWDVVSIKQNPAGTRLAIGIDHLDDTLTVQAEVDIADLTQGPPYNIIPINTGGISAVGGMAFAPDGNLVVSNVVNNTISVISLDTMSVVWGPQSLPSNVSEPVEVLFHLSGNYVYVYVSCRGDNSPGYNYVTGNVVAYSYSSGQLSLLGVYPTGTITTQNLAMNNPGTRLYALNSGDNGCPRCSTPEAAPFPPSITIFTINSDGTLAKISSGLGGTLYNNWPVDDSNFYPTGIALYAPAPRFTAVLWNDETYAYGRKTDATDFNATANLPSAGTITYTGAATGPGTLLSTGVYTLTATFKPTDLTAYIGSSRSIKYTVTKATPIISWNTPASIYPGAPLSSTQLNATVNQNQGLTVAGSLTYNPPSGTVLPVGLHQPLTVTFTPSDTTNYNTLDPKTNLPISATVFIDVNQLPTTLALTQPTNPVNYGAAWSLSATLTDSYNKKVLSGKTVTFSIVGANTSITLPAATDANGVASVLVSGNLNAGSYTVTATFANDSTYANASASGSVVISPRPTVLVYTGSTSVTSGSVPTLSAVLTDSSGKVIGGMPITFEIGQVSPAFKQIVTTATTGIASVASSTESSLTGLTSSYTVSVSFPGDANNSPYSISPTIVVSSKPSAILSYTGSTSVNYGDPLTLSAKLTDNNGKALSGQTVTFSIGSTTTTAVTDKSGSASAAGRSSLSSGSYPVTVSFSANPSSSYGNASTSAIVQVNPRPTALALTPPWTAASPISATYGVAPSLSATLTDSVSKSGLSGKTVTFTIGNNTTPAIVTLAGATNSSGVASVSGPTNLSTGSYTVSVNFANDPNYGSSTASGPLQVSPRSTTLTYGGSKSVTYPDAPILAATLVDSKTGAGLSGKTVTFSINGQVKTSSTGDSGATSVSGPSNIPASPAAYSVSVSFTSDDPNYASATASGSVQVNQRPTSLTYTGSTIVTYGLAPPLSARLTDNNGKVIPNMTLTFSISGTTLSVATDVNGNALVSGPTSLSVSSKPYPVSVSFKDPNANYASASASSTVLVNQRPTILSYFGDTNVTYGTAPNLSAQLTDSIYKGISGETITFTINGTKLTAVADGNGNVSVPGPTNLPASSTPYPVSVSFAGDQNNIASSTSGTVLVGPRVTALTYTGSTSVSFGVAPTLSARLTDGGTTPIASKILTFTLNGVNLTGTTGADGTATAVPTQPQFAYLSQLPVGSYTVNVSFIGDQNNITSSATGAFTVKKGTILTYTGDTLIANGATATLSAVLKGTTGPIAGSTITFTFGTGTHAQTCNGATDTTGTASCAISVVAQPLGPGTVVASFAGDTNNPLSSDSKSTLVYALVTGGNFVIGDKNAVVGGAVTFWGAQWWKQNSLSGGSAPASFKGFEDTPAAPSCGTSWTTDPGNSTPPPAGALPAYMGVIVSSSVVKSGSVISGNVVGLVVVKTDAGYAPDPGHTGTGTVVAIIRSCH
jgi:hypothetical protein